MHTKWKPSISNLNATKRAASGKHRQAMQTKQCEKKYFKIHLYSSEVKKSYWLKKKTSEKNTSD